MKDWEKFRTFKERGEWVELQFMAEAASRGFGLSKPWGDSQAYDVGIDSGPNHLRVQVKSTSYLRRTGYYCEFKPQDYRTGYRLDQVDLFAAYVIPENVWYLIPAAVLVREHIQGLQLCPVRHSSRCPYLYEKYREAWGLLAKTRRELRKHRSARNNAKPKKHVSSRERRSHPEWSRLFAGAKACSGRGRRDLAGTPNATPDEGSASATRSASQPPSGGRMQPRA